MQLAIGTVINNKYKITAALGSGGMGAVYAAFQEDLGRIVALKILNIPWFRQDHAMERFEREAKVLSILEHEHLVKLYAVDTFGEAIPFLVTEYVDGVTLSSELAASGQMNWQRVSKIGIQVCQALEYVHSNAIVHRDLKPQNIMLLAGPAEDFAKVLDFGLAGSIQEDMFDTITQTGELLGTAYYLSPEQCSGKKADARSDIYSLACVLYECICGRPPFSGAESVRLLYQHRHEDPLPPSHLASDKSIPENLDQVFLKALQKDPEQRFQSMSEFAEQLKNVLLGATVKLGLIECKKGKTAKILPFLIVICSSAVLAAFLLLKDEKAKSQTRPEMEPYLEAERSLASFVASKRSYNKAAMAELMRTLRLITRICLLSKPQDKTRAIELIESIASLLDKPSLTQAEKSELVSYPLRVAYIEREKLPQYNQGLLSLLIARLMLTYSHNDVLAWYYTRACLCFANSGEITLAKRFLPRLNSNSPDKLQSTFCKSLVGAAIEFAEGHSDNFRRRKHQLYAQIHSIQADYRAEMFLELAELAKRAHDLELLEDCYKSVQSDQKCGAKLYRLAAEALVKMLEEQGRFSEALYSCQMLKERGANNSSPDFEERAESEIARIRELMKQRKAGASVE